MDISKLIGNRLKTLCNEKNITIMELAKKTLVAESSIRKIINNKSTKPMLVTLKKLCDGLDITLGEFFSTPEFDELEQEIK